MYNLERSLEHLEIHVTKKNNIQNSVLCDDARFILQGRTVGARTLRVNSC